MSLVFVSITFEIYDLGQKFQVFFLKLLSVVYRNPGPFILTELSQVCCLPHFHTPFKNCPQILCRIDIRTL